MVAAVLQSGADILDGTELKGIAEDSQGELPINLHR